MHFEIKIVNSIINISKLVILIIKSILKNNPYPKTQSKNILKNKQMQTVKTTG